MLKESYKSNKSLIKTTVICCAIGTAAAIILMAAFAMAVVFFQIDRSYAAPLATVSVAAGCFVSSFTGGKKIGKKGYLFGLLNGGAVFIIITLIALIVSGWSFSLNTVFHLVILVMASVAGGILGVNKIRNKKYI